MFAFPLQMLNVVEYGTPLFYERTYTDVFVFSRYSRNSIGISVNDYNTVNGYINNARSCRRMSYLASPFHKNENRLFRPIEIGL